jgi:hypothetical protein
MIEENSKMDILDRVRSGQEVKTQADAMRLIRCLITDNRQFVFAGPRSRWVKRITKLLGIELSLKEEQLFRNLSSNLITSNPDIGIKLVSFEQGGRTTLFWTDYNNELPECPTFRRFTKEGWARSECEVSESEIMFRNRCLGNETLKMEACLNLWANCAKTFNDFGAMPKGFSSEAELEDFLFAVLLKKGYRVRTQVSEQTPEAEMKNNRYDIVVDSARQVWELKLLGVDQDMDQLVRYETNRMGYEVVPVGLVVNESNDYCISIETAFDQLGEMR